MIPCNPFLVRFSNVSPMFLSFLIIDAIFWLK